MSPELRAKSIKNSARVNAELSPLELKGLLQNAKVANATYKKHIAALKAELAIWRSGGHVEESEWAKSTSAGASAAAAAAPKKAPASPSAVPTTPIATSRSLTPVNPLVEGLRSELEVSRPQTPVSLIALEKDEREDFLRRENELSDLLAEKESALTRFVSTRRYIFSLLTNLAGE